MSKKSLTQRVDDDLRWDTGELGRDLEHAVEAVLTQEELNSINEAADLQMISIRLPAAMIEDFKFIAARNGIRYQTLMRQVLGRFAHAELKKMAIEATEAQKNANTLDAHEDPDPLSLLKYG